MTAPINHTTENPEAMLYRAAEIKQTIKNLQAEYDMLEPAVLNRVKELSDGHDKYALQVGEIGTFIIAKFRKWEYSDSTKQLEVALKDQKKTEEADGTAKAVESEILKFNVKKPDTANKPSTDTNA